MQAIFMRHAQTNYNLLGLCNDDPRVDVHLSPTGVDQAHAAALALRERPIDLIVTSELPRTRQTADIINRYHQAPIQNHSRLNDIRSGFDGRPVSEYFAATQADPLHLAAPGGESLLQHKQRVLPYLTWLQAQTCQTVLTIAHEETLRVVYADAYRLADTELRHLHFANCEIFELTI